MLSPIKKLLFAYFGGEEEGGRVLLLNAWFPKGIYHQLLTTHTNTLSLRLSNIKVITKSSQTQDTVDCKLLPSPGMMTRTEANMASGTCR